MTIRLFLLLCLFLSTAGQSQAQEPVTLTGQVNDGGVTRTITLTLVFTPVEVSPYQQSYTTTLTTGNDLVLDRSASYGEIIMGAGGVMALMVLGFGLVAGVIYGRNG